MQKKLKIKSGKKNLENLYVLCTVDAFLGTFYSKMKPFIKRQKIPTKNVYSLWWDKKKILLRIPSFITLWDKGYSQI